MKKRDVDLSYITSRMLRASYIFWVISELHAHTHKRRSFFLVMCVMDVLNFRPASSSSFCVRFLTFCINDKHAFASSLNLPYASSILYFAQVYQLHNARHLCARAEQKVTLPSLFCVYFSFHKSQIFYFPSIRNK